MGGKEGWMKDTWFLTVDDFWLFACWRLLAFDQKSSISTPPLEALGPVSWLLAKYRWKICKKKTFGNFWLLAAFDYFHPEIHLLKHLYSSSRRRLPQSIEAMSRYLLQSARKRTVSVRKRPMWARKRTRAGWTRSTTVWKRSTQCSKCERQPLRFWQLCWS